MNPEQCAIWFGTHAELDKEKNLIAIPLIDRNANVVGAIALMMPEGEIDLGRKKWLKPFLVQQRWRLKISC